MLPPAILCFGRVARRYCNYHAFFHFFMAQRKKKKTVTTIPLAIFRSFRSEASLDALRSADVHGVTSPAWDGDDAGGLERKAGIENAASFSENCASTSGYNLVLYNYPSFTGAIAALFARLYHSACRIPALLLPFSSVEPFRVEDLKLRGLETCYLLDFIGPERFAVELSRFIPNVVAFDHRNSAPARVVKLGRSPENLKLHIDLDKNSARAVYDYFSKKLSENFPEDDPPCLLSQKDKDSVDKILAYIEDADLRRWKLLETKAFIIGLKEKYSMLNCVTNPYVFKQLMDIDPSDLISKGKSYLSSRQDAAQKLLGKEFKIRLGRGFYGECLCIRADGHSNLSHEIAVELSMRSAAAGLRPIGAVVFMQRGNLKMCLRTTDTDTDTSEIAKAYGGGGRPSSSSFIIRMDEYNHWTLANLL